MLSPRHKKEELLYAPQRTPVELMVEGLRNRLLKTSSTYAGQRSSFFLPFALFGPEKHFGRGTSRRASGRKNVDPRQGSEPNLKRRGYLGQQAKKGAIFRFYQFLSSYKAHR